VLLQREPATPFAPGTRIPWDDLSFSRRMLREHPKGSTSRRRRSSTHRSRPGRRSSDVAIASRTCRAPISGALGARLVHELHDEEYVQGIGELPRPGPPTQRGCSPTSRTCRFARPIGTRRPERRASAASSSPRAAAATSTCRARRRTASPSSAVWSSNAPIEGRVLPARGRAGRRRERIGVHPWS
jgi:hypothetical protein